MCLPSSLKSYLILLLVCLLNVFTTNSTTTPLEEEAVLFGGNFPALYVIGDSLVDPGNNNYLLTLVRANFPPYGSNFEEGKATGRFSDGKTIADYIAIYYGLPLAPAYMGLSRRQKNKISTGINYASAGCGVFNDTGKRLGRCLSMSVQIDLFNETIEKNLKKQFKTESELSSHLSESLFMTAIGVNDYAFFYNKTTADANGFANRLLHEFLIQLQRLHKLGARNFFVNNIKPLGCYPNIIAKTVPRGSCDDDLNLAISIFNDKLRESLSYMHRRLSNDTSFLYSDYFNFMLRLRGPPSNQASSNLMNTTSPCCPIVYDGASTTTCMLFSTACKVPETFIFFDPRHPTQMANFMYAIQCFQEREVCHVVRDST